MYVSISTHTAHLPTTSELIGWMECSVLDLSPHCIIVNIAAHYNTQNCIASIPVQPGKHCDSPVPALLVGTTKLAIGHDRCLHEPCAVRHIYVIYVVCCIVRKSFACSTFSYLLASLQTCPPSKVAWRIFERQEIILSRLIAVM